MKPEFLHQAKQVLASKRFNADPRQYLSVFRDMESKLAEYAYLPEHGGETVGDFLAYEQSLQEAACSSMVDEARDQPILLSVAINLECFDMLRNGNKRKKFVRSLSSQDLAKTRLATLWDTLDEAAKMDQILHMPLSVLKGVYRTKFYPDAPPDALDDAARSALSLKEALEQGVLANFYQMPDSTASNLFFETLGAGKAIADLPARKKQVNHQTALEVLEHGKSRRIALSSAKAQVTIEVSDIDKLAGNNKQAKKFFALALIKANEQAIQNGQLTRNYVSFPLQELIDIGFYSTPQSARKGFRDGMSILTSMKIKGHIQQTRKITRSIEALEVLFTGARIENGQCTIFLNDRVDWNFIVQYFTILPRYYFTLPNRASDLLYYIFYLARQHTQDIAERGRFNISFRAIQQRLQLPNEVGCPNPARDIQQAIENAIEEIEQAHRTTCQNMDLSLLPMYKEGASIAEYLDNGYLQVILHGEFAKDFLKISKETAKQLEKAQKRQEKITDQARAANLSKRLTPVEKENKKGKKEIS